MASIRATINDFAVEVPAGTTILEAARKAQARVPTLCRHPDLPAMEGCGICVVKVISGGDGSSRMIRACCTPLEEGMSIITHDAELASVRRTVLELILSHHPNECLTCLRNGTCELQKLAAEFGIRSDPFPRMVPDLQTDCSTKTICLDPRKCIKCGRCTYVCQTLQDVWALSFLERGIHTRISPAGDIDLADSPCIRCGQCSAHCPTGAITEHDQSPEVWDMLIDPNLHCVAQIAPAVRVSVGDAMGLEPGQNLTGQLCAALRRMGFDAVFDTNFGADVTIMEEASEFVRRLGDESYPLPLITTCCPSWVDFMEKFHHDMIPYFSSCKSPHAIVGTLIKTYYAQKAGIDPSRIRVISIMPCTSKKYEIGRSGEMFSSGQQDVDVSITTRELSRMISQAGIDFVNLPSEPADELLGQYSGAGTIFGSTGGVAVAAIRSAYHFMTGGALEEIEFQEVRGLDRVKVAEIALAGRKIRVAVAHGLGNVEQVLERIRQSRDAGGEPAFHLVEAMACPGGCIGGGGESWGITEDIRRKRVEALAGDDRNQAVRCSHENPGVQQLYSDFLGQPLGPKAVELLHTKYTPRPKYRR